MEKQPPGDEVTKYATNHGNDGANGARPHKRTATTWTHIRTLLWKNWVLKRRHYIACFMEICLPVLYIILLSWLKTLSTDVHVPAGFNSPDYVDSKHKDTGSTYPLTDNGWGIGSWELDLPMPYSTSPRYVMTESTMSGLLMTLGVKTVTEMINLDELNAKGLTMRCTAAVGLSGAVSADNSSATAVPASCQAHVIPERLGIAPDNAFTRKYFFETVKQWYPRVEVCPLVNMGGKLAIPSLEDSTIFFDDEKAMDKYIQSFEYGRSFQSPKLYAAIVFDKFPDDSSIGTATSIEYSIRMNATLREGGLAATVPRTVGDPPFEKPFSKTIDTAFYGRYAIDGFMTLQTLVARFLNCMPEWDATAKTTSGKCQQPKAVAKSDKAIDDMLFQTYQGDLMIRNVLDNFFNTGYTQGDVFWKTFGTIDAIGREQLLVPLRQAPQPVYGSASVMPFPLDAYLSSPFFSYVSNVFPLVFVLMYLYAVSRVLVMFIQEKETKSREYMKILGVQDNTIVFSWYLTYTIIFFFACVLQTIAAKAGLFGFSDPVIIFLFFFLFSLTVIAYGFLISTMFSRARTGAIVGIVLFFLMYFVSAGFSSSSTTSAKAGGCLLSPVALTFGIQSIANVESTGIGMNFANANLEADHFRFEIALSMMLLDIVLYTLLGLYLERVIPKEFGTTEKWYFPLSPEYWQRQFGLGMNAAVAGAVPIIKVASCREDQNQNPNLEKISVAQQQQEQTGDALVIQNISKEFPVPGGIKKAVKQVTLSMFKDQITCLLGHNGAGKTTLISMLTGMTPPTEGDAFFHGLSFKRNMHKVRQSLGLCFQHDVLYPELTVQEHLQFYGRIKGYTGKSLREVVDTKIKDVGLTEKRKVFSRGLSGGMKRKLSVAISLLGDSSLVFLDEPTSGMDPYSRRSTWEILLNHRNGRVMVLTTHFMDEADILGDRIAIMAEGQLRCCGSSLFLKSRYGAGYNFTLVKRESGCDEAQLMAFVTGHVPDAKVLSNVGAEIAFQLPLDSVSSFADMFEELDSSLTEHGVLSYGISVTTMEEVFIKVAEAEDADHQHTLNKEAGSPLKPHMKPTPAAKGPSIENLTGWKLFAVHVKALWLKRFRVAKRDNKVVIFSALLPIVLLATGLGLLMGSTLTTPDPKLGLTSSKFQLYKDMTTPFYCELDQNDWCTSTMAQVPKSDAISSKEFGSPPLYDSTTPVVFGAKYLNPPIDPSGTSGYCVRFSEMVFQRAFGSATTEAVAKAQYGGFLVYANESANVFGYATFINTTATHAAPILKNDMDQALYRVMAKDKDPRAATTITLKVNNYPLPMTSTTKAIFSSFLSFTACLFIPIAFAFFPVSIVVFLVKEKQAEHNSKHQQLVSGVSLPAFWIANYLWDILLYSTNFVAAIILIKAFDISVFTGNSDCMSCTSATFPSVVLIFALFGLAIAPITYIMSYLFKEYASSLIYTIMINFLLGIVLMIMSFILDLFESSKTPNKYLKYLWRLSPLYNLGTGLLNLTMQEMKYNFGWLGDLQKKPSPLKLDTMGWEVIFLALESFVFMLVAIGIDYLLSFPKIKAAVFRDPRIQDTPYEDDEDVARERERVLAGNADSEAVVLKKIRKVYSGKKVAIQSVSFGLPKGECFGYLGINGAGKTTTMKVLTGDILATSGSGRLGGFDILTQQLQVRRLIGYCPQFDALFELLSVREHLELFAVIKGVPQNQVNQVVKDLMNQMNLNDFENKLAGTLSGGNKRKLSVAIALIGSPPIIFLDEPSTGMDPVSRRFMWNVIADISTQRKESTIILTTHSMEECEALCTRVGIMVGGRLRCLGSVQHLKNRFGNGLTIEIKLDAAPNAEVEARLLKHFGSTDIPNFTRADLKAKCEALGNAAWVESITVSHATGYAIDAALERDTFVRPHVFCAWWIGEERFHQLDAFLQTSFGADNVRLVERQSDLCHYKLTQKTSSTSSQGLKLAKVFRLIENAKQEQHIRNYSVSQTTLEQIFNFFAAQQNEEKRVARGMVAG